MRHVKLPLIYRIKLILETDVNPPVVCRDSHTNNLKQFLYDRLREKFTVFIVGHSFLLTIHQDNVMFLT